MWICRAGGGSLPLGEAPRGLPGPAPPALDLTPRLLAWLLGSEPEALRAHVPVTSRRPLRGHAARPRRSCAAARAHAHTHTHRHCPAGGPPSGSGSATTGRGSASTGSAGACTTAASATAASRPRARGTWSPPARRRLPSRAPSPRSPARCPRSAAWGGGRGRGGGARPCPEASRLCSRPPSLPPSLPDCGSAGPRPGIPPPGRGGPAPCPAPTADPRRPVPHLLHQRPLGLLPPASPQEGVCGPHELSSGCGPPQGEGPPSPTPNPQSSP